MAQTLVVQDRLQLLTRPQKRKDILNVEVRRYEVEDIEREFM